MSNNVQNNNAICGRVRGPGGRRFGYGRIVDTREIGCVKFGHFILPSNTFIVLIWSTQLKTNKKFILISYKTNFCFNSFRRWGFSWWDPTADRSTQTLNCIDRRTPPTMNSKTRLQNIQPQASRALGCPHLSINHQRPHRRIKRPLTRNHRRQYLSS